MADDKAGATIEIPEKVTLDVVVPEVSELKDAGFNQKELDAAKKHGLIKPEAGDKSEAEKAEEKRIRDAELAGKTDAEKKATDEKAAAEKAAKEKAEKDKAGKAETPEIGELLVQLDKIDDEKKVHEILDKMGIKNTKDHNFFLEARRDRKKRQTAQAERDHALVQLKFQQQKNAEMEKRLETLEKGGKTKEEEINDGFIVDPVTGEKTEKPLTKSDLEKLAADREEAAKKDHEKKVERARAVTAAVYEQEKKAKDQYENFDEVVDQFTTEILQNINTLDKIFPDDPKTQRKVRTLARQAFQLAGQADQIPDGELNAADLSYEIGTLHPKYKPGASGQDADKGGNGGAGGGDADAEKVKKALEEQKKSRSSAGLNGGSARRTVSVQDLTLADVEKLPHAEFARLRKEHPKVIERLLREKSEA